MPLFRWTQRGVAQELRISSVKLSGRKISTSGRVRSTWVYAVPRSHSRAVTDCQHRCSLRAWANAFTCSRNRMPASDSCWFTIGARSEGPLSTAKTSWLPRCASTLTRRLSSGVRVVLVPRGMRGRHVAVRNSPVTHTAVDIP
eukprot:scaffold865_cov65-Phaeocystis_antarctica.AAC.8